MNSPACQQPAYARHLRIVMGLDVRRGAAFPDGVAVGHWTNAAGTSGCTVVIPPLGNVTSYDARGAAPGSRELACLDVTRARTEVHAIVLAGGSAYGLAAADGAMRWLEERRIGFALAHAVVPIVPAAIIADRAAGSPQDRPDSAAGYAACDAAVVGEFARGRVGAGAGATAGKWAGLEFGVRSGLGSATAQSDVAAATALAVANPAGDVIDVDGRVLAGTTNPDPRMGALPPRNTVLAVVIVEAVLTKPEVAFLAARGSDGITLSTRPAHTRYDGDVVFAIAIPPRDPKAPAPNFDHLALCATSAVAEAVRDAAG